MGPDEMWPNVPLANHPATLPVCRNLSESANDQQHELEAQHALQRLSRGPELADLAENVIWRDSLALTGTFRTFFGARTVREEWKQLSEKCEPGGFAILPGSVRVVRCGAETGWVQAGFEFWTSGAGRAGRCSGTVGICPWGGEGSGRGWKIWLLCTVLEQPAGFPDVEGLAPGSSDIPGQIAGELSGMNRDGIGANGEETPPIDCLVVGAGIGGLCMAARLKALELSYVVIDKNEEVGDVWSKERYDSVRLHTSKQYNQLPGRPSTFTEADPYLLTGKYVSDGFRRYVDMFGINVITNTCLEKAQFSDEEKEKGKFWHAQLRQRSGRSLSIRARHIVLAIGDMGVTPQIPQYENRHLFPGTITHAQNWKNARPWHGKRGIVIGSGNSAHDIIADMAAADFHAITLIQRSPTFVLPLSTFSALVDPIYNTATPLETSDRALLSLPLPIARLTAMAGIRAHADQQPEKFDTLERRGFKTRRYGDLWGQLYNSQGKHFFDIGSGDLIAEGTVHVRSDALPVAYTDSGLVLDDGSRIEADVIAFATGYTSHFASCVREILGEDVAGRVRPFWGTDAEGEVRGAWKPTGHHGLWYTGHGFAHARYYSRFVAFQIKADVLGRPFEAYEAKV